MSSDTTKTSVPATTEIIRSAGDSLLDQIDIALYAVDALGRCVRINRAGEALLGYTQAEALGQDMHELVHSKWPDGRPYPPSECTLLRARSSHMTISGLQEVFWAKHGTPVPVECSASPARMADGSVGAIVTLKDRRGRISAEREKESLLQEQLEAMRQRDAAARVASDLAAEAADRQRKAHADLERAAADQLREQQELLGTVAQLAPVGIAVFDSDAHYRWTNKSYLDSMDPAFHHVEIRGTSFFDTVAAANVEELKGIFAEVKSSGEAFSAVAYPLAGVQRGTTYWRWSLSRLANGDLMSTSGDVTEQVNTRSEVESVYANAPIALSLIDVKSLTYLRVNVRYASLFGTTESAMLGKRVGSFSISPQTEQILDRAAHGTVIANQVLRMELVSTPGETLSLLANVTPNRNSSGELETISIALTDVTAQKRAEDALVQADKLAAVGRLAASISHEINNPLEAVTNLLYLVHQDPLLSSESYGYIEQAEQELQRVSHIASQTLRFQRHAVKAVPISARLLVDPVIALYQGRLKHTKIEVVVTHCGPEEDMVVFEGDVRQILNNLIGNAIDASSGGGRISVRTKPARCVHTRRRGTRISIADSGHGMSEEVAAHIFEPFYTTKGSNGSGLGLWISHSLALRHGGTLRVRSRKANADSSRKSGTVFSLFLPNLDPQKTTTNAA